MMFGRRIAKLLRGIRKVREGDYGHRVDIPGDDELSDLGNELNELSIRFEQVESMRQRFVSDASHELKTPLASVKILADSIMQTDNMPPEMVKEFVGDIGDEINRLTRLTEKLLKITRLDADIQSEVSAVDLKGIVIRAEHMLEPLAKESSVKIQTELEEGCFIEANRDDCYQIVFNLMENAVKYNKIGGKVSVYLFKKEGQVTLIVNDTGIGIPEEDVGRVFDRFYRVDKARSREAGGSGLGLAIVENAVTRFGGKIEISSKLGEGTRISLTFAAADPGKEDIDA